MHSDSLDYNSREDYCYRDITHEFGQAIGCVREHQANPVHWNKSKAIVDRTFKFG